MDNLFNKLENINFKKVEKKAIIAIVGFIGGYFLVNLASKFVEDNWTFRIKPISNKPDDSAKQN